MKRKYEKIFSIDYIFRVLVRHWKMIAIIFASGSLFGMTLSIINNKKIFYSEGSLQNNSVLGQQHFNNIKIALTNPEFIDSVVLSLNDLDVKHSDGTAVTISDINDGVVFPIYVTSSQSAYYNLQFKGLDSKIIIPTLSCYLEKAVDVLTTSGGFPNIRINSLPIDIYTYQSSLSKNILLSFLISAVVSYAIALLSDYLTDYIYDCNQVLELGCNVFEVCMGKKVDKKSIDLQIDSFNSLINYKYFPKIIGVVSPNINTDSLMISNLIADNLGKTKKVLHIFINQPTDHKATTNTDLISIEIADGATSFDDLTKKFDDFKSRYDCVVAHFNSLLQEHTALLFCKIVDIMIIAVKYNYTTGKSLFNSILSLNDAGFNNIYALLINNNKSFKTKGSEYLSRFKTIDI